MEYYKVKPQFDQIPTNRGILVANEIYTRKEIEKLRDNKGGLLRAEYFEKKEISKRGTHWFFGARFENEGRVAHIKTL